MSQYYTPKPLVFQCPAHNLVWNVMIMSYKFKFESDDLLRKYNFHHKKSPPPPKKNNPPLCDLETGVKVIRLIGNSDGKQLSRAYYHANLKGSLWKSTQENITWISPHAGNDYLPWRCERRKHVHDLHNTFERSLTVLCLRLCSCNFMLQE